MRAAWLVAFSLPGLGCRPYAPPAVKPAMVVAAAPLRTESVEGTPPAVSVVVRAGSAYDPPSREGLAFLAAHALAARAPGTTVQVGPDLVVFTTSPADAKALADALAAPIGEDALTLARSDAYAALRTRDCSLLAVEVGETWLFSGHPYGHAAAGRHSTLPTITLGEVQAFRDLRYVRDAAVVGLDGAPGAGSARAGTPQADPAGSESVADSSAIPSFDAAFAPRLSRSVTPAVRPKTPRPSIVVEARVDRACMFAAPVERVEESRHAAAARAAAAWALGSPGAVARVDAFPRLVLSLPGDGFAAALSLAAGLDGPVLSLPFERARDAVRARLLHPTAIDRASDKLIAASSATRRPTREQLAAELERMSADEFALWAHKALGPGTLATVLVTPDASAWRRLESSPKPIVLDSEDLLR